MFSVGFISAVSCLHAEQSADYKAAFTCFKTGHDADTHSLEVQGIEATSEEMIASGCKFGKVSFEIIELAIREGAVEKDFSRTK